MASAKPEAEAPQGRLPDHPRFIATETERAGIADSPLNHALGRDVTSGYIQLSVDRLREPAQRIADRLDLLCTVPTRH